MAKPMPAIFFGHGNPMNALLKNEYSAAWAEIGASLPLPRAVRRIFSGDRPIGPTSAGAYMSSARAWLRVAGLNAEH